VGWTTDSPLWLVGAFGCDAEQAQARIAAMPRIARVAVAALALSLLAPAVAHADRWSSPDETGDVEGFNYDPEPAPCGTITDLDGSADTNTDISRIGVRHTRRAVVVTTRFRDIKSAREQNLSINLRASTGGYELDLYREAPSSGAWHVYSDLWTEPDYPDPDDVPECQGFGVISDGVRCRVEHEIDFADELIRLSLLRTCIGNPRWVRVAAQTSRFVDQGSTFDLYFDEWDDGVKLNYWLPPFGPRVRARDGAPIGGTRTAPAIGGERRHLFVSRDGIIARR
jgi:hypothetical protein